MTKIVIFDCVEEHNKQIVAVYWFEQRREDKERLVLVSNDE